MKPSLFPLSAALALLLAPACISPAPERGGASAGPAGDEEEDGEDRAWKIAGAEHALAVAKAELDIAAKQAPLSIQEAEEAVSGARLEVSQKEHALVRFRELEAPTDEAESKLGVDRAKNSLEERVEELDQLRKDYEVHDAGKTGAIVIKRAEHRIEYARRELEVAEKKHEWVGGKDVPTKRRLLEEELEASRRELARAERELEVARMKTDLDLQKARRDVAEHEHELAELRKEAGQ